MSRGLSKDGMRNCPKCKSMMTLSTLAECVGTAHAYTVRFGTLTCSHCGLEQLAYERAFQAEMPDAVLAAFDSVSLER